MLSPHVDHLFDKGFISFNDDGGLKKRMLLTLDQMSILL